MGFCFLAIYFHSAKGVAGSISIAGGSSGGSNGSNIVVTAGDSGTYGYAAFCYFLATGFLNFSYLLFFSDDWR